MGKERVEIMKRVLRIGSSLKQSIPPHWLHVAGRGSPLSKGHGARHAVCPVQAILNYAYALLESQVRQALEALGLDLACGVLHADVLHRDSLVYDLMEGYRAGVDHLVLQRLAKTTFGKGDLMKTPDGTVKFHPQLSRYLLTVCRLPQAEIDEGAAWLKAQLL